MKGPGTLPLLVEVGCEEIPARFLEEAQRNFADALEIALGQDGFLPAGYKAAQSYSTPRRLVAWFPEVLERSPDKVEDILGPPVRIGIDATGKLTKAAEGFAARYFVPARKLVRVKTPKGEYMAVRLVARGRLVLGALPRLLLLVLEDTGARFAKSMYWVAASGPRFVRPIRWLVALLGEGRGARTIPFEIAGVKAGNVTYGHRVLGNRGIRIRGFEEYARALRKARVEFDPEERRRTIHKQLKVLLEGRRLTVVPDKWLEDWTVNSTEWPWAIVGSYDRRYLGLPPEILVTVMRDHQKYFAVENRKGELQPRFVAVLNQDSDRKGWIRQGHERVLGARFTDAEFFWAADQKLPLRERGGHLAKVTYERELGSYADKARRMKAIAAEVCRLLEATGRITAADMAQVLRAVELAKCDLTTQMVQEFPELQGIVGGLYARAQGELPEVADAIYDHYLPVGLEDRCPRSVTGAVVSLADKIDSVVGGFAIGQEPTGSSDPFALRRQGNGILKVMVEACLPIALKPIIELALNSLDMAWRKPRFEVFNLVVEFLGERLRYYLETVRKLRYDTVRAVLASDWDVPEDAWRRAEALEKIRGGENFEALSVAAKRIKNILAKSATASDWEPGEVDVALLVEGPECSLHREFELVATEVASQAGSGDYRGALESIATLRPAVDLFFDKVLVMAEDRALRRNRLRLLGKLDQLFSGIAQFAEIAGGPANVGAST